MKVFFKSPTALLLIMLGALVFLPQWGVAQEPEPEPTPSLTGYAWSSNIGWILLEGSNYGLEIEDDGSVEGYAWSSNIGWIKFGGLSSFPGGVSKNENARVEGDDVVGWARACAGTVSGTCNGPSRTDGWDGWIYLGDGGNNNCNAYGVFLSNGSPCGFAWGGDVIGWIRFYSTPPDPVIEAPVPPPSGCLSVGTLSPCTNSTRVRAGNPATLYWESANAVSCTVRGTNGEEWSSLNETSGQVTSPIQVATRYTMTCSGAEGADPLTITSSVLINIIPTFQEI